MDKMHTGLPLASALSSRSNTQPRESQTDCLAVRDTQLPCTLSGGNSSAPQGLHQTVQLFQSSWQALPVKASQCMPSGGAGQQR
jgi:hypothetical protein